MGAEAEACLTCPKNSKKAMGLGGVAGADSDMVQSCRGSRSFAEGFLGCHKDYQFILCEIGKRNDKS